MLPVLPVLQYCLEGVFVPGGAPHQVRNLRSSIKVGGGAHNWGPLL